MNPVPMAKYFDRIGREEPSGHGKSASRGFPLKPAAPRNSPDAESRINEAYERGVKKGHASAASELAVASELERARREQQELSELRAMRSVEHSQFMEKLEAGLLEIEERVSATVARILIPFLKIDTATKVALALAETLQAMFGSEAPRMMKISGPENELEELKRRMAAFAVDVRYSIESGVDVAIQIDDTTIKTQLGKWIAVIDSVGA